MTDRKRLGSEPRKIGAEFVGTFAMVFAGCGAVAANTVVPGAVGHVGICLTFGLTVCAMIYATGHISGAHFNPAVTIAFASVGRFPWREVPAYLLGQGIAAVLAIWLLAYVVQTDQLGATVPTLPIPRAFLTEVIVTFFLMFVISAVATDHRAVGQMAGVAIGATVTLCALFAGPLTGASMNPARSLGPALLSTGLEWMWLYTLAPIVGAVLAAMTYRWLRCSAEPGQDAKGCC